jgi:dolichyl-phosphate beta-glucosyltransferase
MVVFQVMPNVSDIKLSVIIPAYNEELRLPKTLTQSIDYLQSQPYRSEIIVVNDGSTDGTERVVRQQSSATVPIRLLIHPDGANHGKGASVKCGMMAARGSYRLFMDADNSTTLDQVERFWPFFDQGYQIVIGSRAMKDSVIGIRQARYKELAGRLGNWVIRTFAVPGISDTQAGFKIFTDQAVDRIFPRQTLDRWGYDIELLAIAQLYGYRIAEVPITWINAIGSKVTMGAYIEVLGEVWRIRRNLKAGIYKSSN